MAAFYYGHQDSIKKIAWTDVKLNTLVFERFCRYRHKAAFGRLHSQLFFSRAEIFIINAALCTKFHRGLP
jgi:hypothetical protein